MTNKLEDVQNTPDFRQIPIDMVGVTDLRYPVYVLDRSQNRQQTVAVIAVSVNLPHDLKGTHMSRFVEILNDHRGEMTMNTLPAILREMKERYQAQSARMEMSFPYFMERTAPVSGLSALMDYECRFTGEMTENDDDFVMCVKVPISSLCPCSKAISDYGAHNQRGYVTMDVRTGKNEDGTYKFIWIEELIELAEKCGSSPVYPLLKRPDERHVTMQAYDNPVFVEDIVRNVAGMLMSDDRVSWFKVHAVNFESIHNHSAFAQLEWRRTGE
ncbi:MAG: GTP cyclohydrolase FolE2 [Firmicutes bacterium]|nr:GTP cyclohydrolase FolE2 [Bacillota bacterium]